MCCRDSPAFPVRVDYLAPDLTPSSPPLIREPVKVLGEFSEVLETLFLSIMSVMFLFYFLVAKLTQYTEWEDIPIWKS